MSRNRRPIRRSETAAGKATFRGPCLRVEAKHGLDRLGSGKTINCPRTDEKRGSTFSPAGCGFRRRDRCFTQLYRLEPLPEEMDHVGRKNWDCFLFRVG